MNIAVLLGGISRERDISLKSGRRIAQALRNKGHNVEEIDVKEDFLEKLSYLKKFDLLFNILHGTFGEDGRVQAILESLNVPFTGSGVDTCVITFDKYITYKYLEGLVDIPKTKLITEYEKPFVLPCVVKPRKEGSSIGTYVCFTEEEYNKAVAEELPKYKSLLVQEFIRGQEITVSIIDIDSTPTVLPILELRPKKLFYDYEAKYTDGMTEFVIPAEIPENLAERVREISLKIYKTLGCRHFSRVDGIISNGKFYFLEVNTLPGMTELSDLPISAKAYGIDFEQLVELIAKESYSDFKQSER